nr:MAG TPA: hypothetical protein [Bacteriophage sp.]
MCVFVYIFPSSESSNVSPGSIQPYGLVTVNVLFMFLKFYIFNNFLTTHILFSWYLHL